MIKKLLFLFLFLIPFSGLQATEPRPSVVRVESYDRGSNSLGTGTAIAWINNQGLVITANHVVRDIIGKVTVTFPSGEPILVTIAATDKSWDLAALIFNGSVCPVSKLSNKTPDVGMPLTIAGYGSGTYREATGIVKKFFSPLGNYPADIVAIDVAARSGDSGGGMFYMDGSVAAVLFGSDSLGAYGTHCIRIRQFIKTSLNEYPTLQEEALRIPEDYLLYGLDKD
jgi:S1-C subfamily serine protease